MDIDILEDKIVIEYLRNLKFIGLINTKPIIDELLVPIATATLEVNYNLNIDLTEDQLRSILDKHNIRRRTLDEVFKIRFPDKQLKRRKRR